MLPIPNGEITIDLPQQLDLSHHAQVPVYTYLHHLKRDLRSAIATTHSSRISRVSSRLQEYQLNAANMILAITLPCTHYKRVCGLIDRNLTKFYQLTCQLGDPDSVR